MKKIFFFKRNKMTLKLTAELWGGFVETLEECENNLDSNSRIKTLKEKLARLEASKNLEDIQYSIHFTKEERNYLNSSLLDEIYSTIFSDTPIEKAIESCNILALQFYLERGEEMCNIDKINLNISNAIRFEKSQEKILGLLHFLEKNNYTICDSNFYEALGTPHDKVINFFLAKNTHISSFAISFIPQLLRRGMCDIAKKFFYASRNVEIINEIFFAACSQLDMRFIKDLVENYGADVNYEEATTYAYRGNHKELLEYLLSRGGRVTHDESFLKKTHWF